MTDTGSYRRLFTVDEARALLPVIRPEIEALLGTFKQIRDEIEQTATHTGLAVDSPDLAGHLQARGILPPLFERVKESIDRIHHHGCLVNGPEAGLVDFPCLYDNEIVFLCWKYGEPTIGHWHRIPDGFAGRKPLLDDSMEDGSLAVH